MIDVVLPCLNEAAALPLVLSRLPAGYRPIVADNGSTDGSAGVAASLRRAWSSRAPGRVRRRRARRAARGRPSDGRGVLHGRRRLVRSRRSCPASPTRSRPAGPSWRSAGAGPTGRGHGPLHARLGNAAARLAAAAARPAPRARPRADAGRAPRRLLGAGPARPPLRLPAGDAPRRRPGPGWRIEEVDVAYAPARPAAGPRSPARVLGTARAVRDMTRCSAHDAGPSGHRQAAGARAGQDPALPAVHARAGGRRRRRRAGGHARRRRTAIAAAAAGRSWSAAATPAPPGWSVVAQRGDGLGERLANAFARHPSRPAGADAVL